MNHLHLYSNKYSDMNNFSKQIYWDLNKYHHSDCNERILHIQNWSLTIKYCLVSYLVHALCMGGFYPFTKGYNQTEDSKSRWQDKWISLYGPVILRKLIYSSGLFSKEYFIFETESRRVYFSNGLGPITSFAWGLLVMEVLRDSF